jgi:DNA-binding transcriptional LysR family regulator
VSLCVRAPRRLYLTPAGARLLKEVREVFIRVERAQRAVRETDACCLPSLRIGMAQPSLAQCFARWQKLAAEMSQELAEMRATELVAALKREDVDAGFSFGLPDGADGLIQNMRAGVPVSELLRQGAAPVPSGAEQAEHLYTRLPPPPAA